LFAELKCISPRNQNIIHPICDVMTCFAIEILQPTQKIAPNLLRMQIRGEKSLYIGWRYEWHKIKTVAIFMMFYTKVS